MTISLSIANSINGLKTLMALSVISCEIFSFVKTKISSVIIKGEIKIFPSVMARPINLSEIFCFRKS